MEEKIMKRANAAILAIICTIGLFGAMPAPASGKAQPGYQRLRNNRANLAFIQERIRKKLASLPYFSVFDNLSFSYDGETVVLNGEVVRASTRSEAEHAIRDVEGVERIVNNIQVLPLSPMDDRIRASAYQQIFSHPQFTRYAMQPVPPIHIIVSHGHLRLEGVVANEADKTLAGMLANQLDGVFSVDNNLRVEH
jgi:hyperosmotically inducible periplasmic protein